MIYENQPLSFNMSHVFSRKLSATHNLKPNLRVPIKVSTMKWQVVYRISNTIKSRKRSHPTKAFPNITIRGSFTYNQKVSMTTSRNTQWVIQKFNRKSHPTISNEPTINLNMTSIPICLKFIKKTKITLKLFQKNILKSNHSDFGMNVIPIGCCTNPCLIA